MNVSMWLKALQTIPRINKDEWGKLDIISRWLIATPARISAPASAMLTVSGSPSTSHAQTTPKSGMR